MTTDKQPSTLEVSIYKRLSAEFPEEALSTDSSRGFNLTSVKAQYVKARLTEVLGITGWTWTGEYRTCDAGVLFFGILTVKVGDILTAVEGVGFSATKKNTGDTYKSANTDALSKAASSIGVADSVFKGQVAPPTKAVSTQKTVTTSKWRKQ